MRPTKRLAAVPVTPKPEEEQEKRPLGRRPIDSPRTPRVVPRLTDAEVGKALRRVVLDHTGRDYREVPVRSGMSHFTRMVWTLLIVGIIAVAAVANRPSTAPQPTIKTYPLQGK